MYEDKSFQGKHALYWPNFLESPSMANTYNEQVTGWARPSELVSKPSLWGSRGVVPDGVKQGQLGDCWFLASAAALAEHPDRIRDLFLNTEYSAEGVFEVILYHRGSPYFMVVDDRLPIYEGKDKRYTDFGVKRTVNSGPSVYGAWWLPLLEKAYAKFNQNYAQLDGGNPEQALRELTGMPVETYDARE